MATAAKSSAAATVASASSWIGSFANVPKKSASTTTSKTTAVVAGSVPQNPSFYSDPSEQYHTQTREYSEEEFKAAQAAAAAEQKKYWDLQRSRTNEDADTKMKDYDRLIGYSNTDLTRNLEQNNITFGRAMNRAANAYGQRGILFSGITTNASNEAASDYGRTNAEATDKTGRQVTEYNNSKALVDRDRNRKIFDTNVEADNASWYSASRKLENADEKEAADNMMKLYNKF